uniref:Zgc:194224 n=1 Tax=Salarias fasciatus TaxID=181472 RepID=A0A672F924_SALFA
KKHFGDFQSCMDAFAVNLSNMLHDAGAAQKKKSKKKNKRKRCEEEEAFPEEDVCGDTEDGGSEAAGLIPAGGQQVTRAEPEVQVITFQDPRKKLKSKQTAAAPSSAPVTEKKQSGQQEELSLEKARLEVHRFGITGYKKEQQRVFEQDRAVMLGARPPKKNYVNYKLLQEQVREKKQRQRDEAEPELKKKKKKRNQQDNRKKASSGPGTAPSGQVGRFRDGMLILSSKEIQKIKGKRGAK